jgi:hypothetical protein
MDKVLFRHIYLKTIDELSLNDHVDKPTQYADIVKEQYENKLKDSQLEMMQYKILLLQNNIKI